MYCLSAPPLSPPPLSRYVTSSDANLVVMGSKCLTAGALNNAFNMGSVTLALLKRLQVGTSTAAGVLQVGSCTAASVLQPVYCNPCTAASVLQLVYCSQCTAAIVLQLLYCS